MMIHHVFNDVEAEPNLRGAVFPFFSGLIKAGPDLGAPLPEAASRRYIRKMLRSMESAQSDGTARFRNGWHSSYSY